mmetsp:Transcript_25523/g.44509  ORF Transcript_25523/g.44509 Transcript_25523/m.44509 type:complete len:127 (-) Transcript_25523:487-867(-)
MATIAETLIPAKFMSLILQFLLTIFAIYTREDNIFAGIDDDASKSSKAYTDAENVLLAGVALSILCNGVELALLFTGMSLFFDRINTIRKANSEIMMHGFGVLFTTWFILDNWVFTLIWPIFVFCR